MPQIQKTECPITKKEFVDTAKPVEVTIGEQKIQLLPKVFSTGSFGLFAQQKIGIQINGKTVVCAMQIQLPVVGSKEAKAE